jgi:hypothetical protein
MCFLPRLMMVYLSRALLYSRWTPLITSISINATFNLFLAFLIVATTREAATPPLVTLRPKFDPFASLFYARINIFGRSKTIEKGVCFMADFLRSLFPSLYTTPDRINPELLDYTRQVGEHINLIYLKIRNCEAELDKLSIEIKTLREVVKANTSVFNAFLTELAEYLSHLPKDITHTHARALSTPSEYRILIPRAELDEALKGHILFNNLSSENVEYIKRLMGLFLDLNAVKKRLTLQDETKNQIINILLLLVQKTEVLPD